MTIKILLVFCGQSKHLLCRKSVVKQVTPTICKLEGGVGRVKCSCSLDIVLDYEFVKLVHIFIYFDTDKLPCHNVGN